jgi:hypothetical protein
VTAIGCTIDLTYCGQTKCGGLGSLGVERDQDEQKVRERSVGWRVLALADACSYVEQHMSHRKRLKGLAPPGAGAGRGGFTLVEMLDLPEYVDRGQRVRLWESVEMR